MNTDDFPGYKLIRKIPKGGITDLYVCDSPANQRVLVRLIGESHKKDRQVKKCFIRGVQILSSLQHPNIVRVLDSGTIRRSPFVIIEYHQAVDGREAILKRNPALTDHALTVVRSLAATLSYLHGQGYLHMDLKPENLLIRETGDIMLVDFDFATAHRSSKAIKLKNLPGTPTYLSPEALRTQRVDERSEVFAFGVVAYELLCFHKPFEANSVTEYKLSVVDPNTAAYPLHEHRPDIAKQLEAIVMKCLNKSPEMRYPSMALVQRDLDALL